MDRPNIVWFCTDQQRYDTITSLGNSRIRTPNIDQFIAQGVTFSRAYAQSPVCTPSRAAFLTGRYPRSTRSSINGNDAFSRDETLVTKMLADAGYTCGLVGKLHLTGAAGRMETRTDDGYSYMEWSHQPCPGKIDWPDGVNRYQAWLREKGVSWKDNYRASFEAWPPPDGYALPDKITGMPDAYHQTTWCVEKAIEFIDRSEAGDAPWCISINPYAPHPPFDPPKAFKDRISIDDMELPLWQEGELDDKPAFQKDSYLRGSQNGMARPMLGMTDHEKREVIRDYYASIEHIDYQFGRLMHHLDAMGIRENTIVIFMSDHGEMLGDHGAYWKGGYFYESVIHVPLILSWPGKIRSGLESTALVELVDLAPTLLELASLPVPQYIQGKSFAGILTGREAPDHHKDRVYAEYYHSAARMNKVYATMCFDGKYKVVVHHNDDMGEIYDLESDPQEFHNLWNDPSMHDKRFYLVKQCFDHAVMSNIDTVMGRRSAF